MRNTSFTLQTQFVSRLNWLRLVVPRQLARVSNPGTNVTNREVLIGLMVPTMMVVLDFSMFGVTLPTIRDYFGIQSDAAAWLITAYTLPFMIMMPLYGRLGDGLGKRRLYLVSVSVFFTGISITLLAPNLAWLMVGRAVQGFGSAGVVPLAIAIISQWFPSDERGKALGTWSTIGPITSIAGPFLGGLLVDNFGWRTIFLPVLLVSLTAFVVILRKLPPLPGAAKVQFDFLQSFDWAGVVLLCATITTFLLFASSRLVTGVASLQDWRLLGVALLLAGSFIYWERRRENPFVNLKIFTHKTFTLASVSANIRMFCMSGINFVIPLYLTDIHNFTAASIGTMFMIHSGGLLITIRLGGQLADRWGSRWLVIWGLLLQVSVMLYLGNLPAAAPIWMVMAGLALNGLGGGLSMAALHRAAMNKITEAQVGTAAGLYSMTRLGGTVFGTALGGVILQSSLQSTALPIAAYQGTFLFVAGVGVLGVILGSRIAE